VEGIAGGARYWKCKNIYDDGISVQTLYDKTWLAGPKKHYDRRWLHLDLIGGCCGVVWWR